MACWPSTARVRSAGAAAAAGEITSPVQNLLIADANHIGFYTTGRVPIRKSGDGTFPVDGADGAHDWTGLVTSEKLPRAIDPPSDELINANNPTVGPDFPVFIARDTYGDWRASRIKFLLGRGTTQTPASFARIQLDTTSLFAQAILPRMLALTLPPGDPAEPALRLLRHWSGDMRADSPQPLIFNAWTRAFIVEVLQRNGFNPETAPLIEDFVPVPDWGQTPCRPRSACGAPAIAARHCMNRLRPRSPHSPRPTEATRLPGPGRRPIAQASPMRSSALYPSSAASRGSQSPSPAIQRPSMSPGVYLVDPSKTNFPAVHGPEFRAVFDLSNLDASLFVIAPGESGNIFSRHAADFLHRWRDGRNIILGANPVAASTITLEPPAAPE